jgi:hypothetical protein
MPVVKSEHTDVAREAIQMYLIAAGYLYYFYLCYWKNAYQRLQLLQCRTYTYLKQRERKN